MLTLEQKKKCIELVDAGWSKEKVYNEIVKGNSDMNIMSFPRMLQKWRRKLFRDEKILEAANLEYRYTPHAATVQVNGKGQVVQAWVKQHTEDCVEQIIRAIKEDVRPVKVKPVQSADAEGMLEIPLYDMHFGIADFEYYREALAEILGVIVEKVWDTIVITVGQDMFHNDAIDKGVTSKGTPIEKVDLCKAVTDARAFYEQLIDTALEYANQVKVIYSPGNHDRTVGWMFAQILKQKYGDIVDDSVRERKAVWWDGCFIGITHGCKGNDTAAGLRGKFTAEYAALYATAKVREIHVGHLHREGESRDEYGIQIRRLPTRNKDDAWTIDEGYMSHKKFMLFVWMPGRLKAIYYI